MESLMDPLREDKSSSKRNFLKIFFYRQLHSRQRNRGNNNFHHKSQRKFA